MLGLLGRVLNVPHPWDLVAFEVTMLTLFLLYVRGYFRRNQSDRVNRFGMIGTAGLSVVGAYYIIIGWWWQMLIPVVIASIFVFAAVVLFEHALQMRNDRTGGGELNGELFEGRWSKHLFGVCVTLAALSLFFTLSPQSSHTSGLRNQALIEGFLAVSVIILELVGLYRPIESGVIALWRDFLSAMRPGRKDKRLEFGCLSFVLGVGLLAWLHFFFGTSAGSIIMAFALVILVASFLIALMMKILTMGEEIN